MDVFVDRQVLLKWEFQPDPVFDVVVRKHEPIVRAQSAWLDQVGAKLNGREVRKALRAAPCTC